jgi:ABC-2 type transport system permease protein
MQTELIVAAKEFKDYLTSKRFLIIFAALILLSIASIIAGVGTYNTQVADYNANAARIHTGSANSTNLAYRTVTMPSMLLVFESFGSNFVTVGWILALAIGFDLISKEKESGTLKLLLSRPAYRDSIINGKILGSSGILIVSLAATFIIALAILLFQGMVPSGDDLSRIVVFFLGIVLFCVAFLAIAMVASTLAKNSTIAILIAIGVVIFAMLLPTFVSTICDISLGSAPAITLQTSSSENTTASTGTSTSFQGGNFNARAMTINPAYTAYWNTRNQITEGLDLLSPTEDFQGILNVVVNRDSSPIATSGIAGRFVSPSGSSATTFGDTLPSILPQVIALLVMILGGFALSYAKFIRMDVR